MPVFKIVVDSEGKYLVEENGCEWEPDRYENVMRAMLVVVGKMSAMGIDRYVIIVENV